MKLNIIWRRTGYLDWELELVSKELNHLAAIITLLFYQIEQ